MIDPVRVMLLEGGRVNLLSGDVEARLSSAAQIISCRRPSVLGDALTWELKLSVSHQYAIELPAAVLREYRDYTFSLYAWTNQPTDLAMTTGIAGSGECVLRHHAPGVAPARFVVKHRFGASPKDLTATIAMSLSKCATGSNASLFLAFPVVEQGLFASMPIELASERGPETLSYPKDGNFFEGDEGTVSVTFIPEWSGSDLSGETNPSIIACFDDTGANSVSIYSNGLRNGLLTAKVVANGVVAEVESGVAPLRDEPHAVALRWAGGIADFIVDGWLAGSAVGIQFPDSARLGKRVYLGCDPRAEGTGLFGGIMSVHSHAHWMDDRSLQAALFEDHPNQFPKFRNVVSEIGNSELRYLVPNSWAMPIIRQLMRYPDLWQMLPPPWLSEQNTSEELFRDELARALGASSFYVSPESHSVEGRTDLLIRTGVDSLRLECKVWGRHDYADVPKKPLKYFTSSERAAAVLMINANKARIGARYRQNVSASPTSCVSIIDAPFGESLPDHFVSLHDAGGYLVEVLHVVFDKYGPFGTPRTG